MQCINMLVWLSTKTCAAEPRAAQCFALPDTMVAVRCPKSRSKPTSKERVCTFGLFVDYSVFRWSHSPQQAAGSSTSKQRATQLRARADLVGSTPVLASEVACRTFAGPVGRRVVQVADRAGVYSR
jgi:hypothetical protein